MLSSIKEPKVSVVIVNYNCSLSTIETAWSLLNSNYSNLEIFIVDNNSKQSEIELLYNFIDSNKLPSLSLPSNIQELTKEYRKGFKFDYRVYMDKVAKHNTTRAKNTKTIINLAISSNNLGFAGGCNLATNIIKDSDFIWYLNPDTLVFSDTINTLVDCYNKIKKVDQSIAMLGSTILNYSDPNIIHSQYKSFDSKILDVRHIPDNVNVSSYKFDKDEVLSKTTGYGVKKVEYLTGSNMLVSKDIFDKVGLMDESFFLNYEETAWQKKMTNNNYSIYTTNSTSILHKVSITQKSSDMNYYITRNRLEFFDRYYSNHLFKRKFLDYFNFNSIKQLLKFDFGYFGVIIKAHKDYNKRVFGIRKSELEQLTIE